MGKFAEQNWEDEQLREHYDQLEAAEWRYCGTCDRTWLADECSAEDIFTDVQIEEGDYSIDDDYCPNCKTPVETCKPSNRRRIDYDPRQEREEY